MMHFDQENGIVGAVIDRYDRKELAGSMAALLDAEALARP